MGWINKLLRRGKVKAKGRTRQKANSYMRKNSSHPGPHLRSYLTTFANHDIDSLYGRKPRIYGKTRTRHARVRKGRYR